MEVEEVVVVVQVVEWVVEVVVRCLVLKVVVTMRLRALGSSEGGGSGVVVGVADSGVAVLTLTVAEVLVR